MVAKSFSSPSSLLVLLLSLLLLSGDHRHTFCHAQTPEPSAATMEPSTEPSILPTGTDQWNGCYDVNDPSALVTVGQKTTICFVIADGIDWREERQYLRLHFQPVADTYSRFHVPRSFEQLFIDTSSRVTSTFSAKNITVHTGSQMALSFQKYYYRILKDPVSGGVLSERIFPHLTAIIDVRDGVVQGIAWDDSCVFCAKNECEENTIDFNGRTGRTNQPTGGCFIDLDVCKGYFAEGRTDCDLVLYTVWTGTDSNGNSLVSSPFRFSAFPAQELSDRFSQNLPDFPSVEVPDLGFSGGNDGSRRF